MNGGVQSFIARKSVKNHNSRVSNSVRKTRPTYSSALLTLACSERQRARRLAPTPRVSVTYLGEGCVFNDSHHTTPHLLHTFNSLSTFLLFRPCFFRYFLTLAAAFVYDSICCLCCCKKRFCSACRHSKIHHGHQLQKYVRKTKRPSSFH